MPLPRPVDALAEDGRGLGLVDLVADRWGYRGNEHGHTVWFELRGNRLSQRDPGDRISGQDHRRLWPIPPSPQWTWGRTARNGTTLVGRMLYGAGLWPRLRVSSRRWNGMGGSRPGAQALIACSPRGTSRGSGPTMTVWTWAARRWLGSPGTTGTRLLNCGNYRTIFP